MNKFFHPYHLVTISPWPILISFRIFNNLIISIYWINSFQTLKEIEIIIFLCYILRLIFESSSYCPITFALFLSFIPTIICLIQWWRDIIRESSFQGYHTLNVYIILRFGIIIFITSEILFFFSFFWTYFHSSLAPNIEIGQFWPPFNIIPFNPYDIPLLNTIILVSSGLTITWTHYAIASSNLKDSKISLFITIFLGFFFTLIQIYEYFHSFFTFSDSIYGSTFFIATGFHGLHVIIGSTFLFICLFRLIHSQFSKTHHFGFEAAAWYWHFVDVVWLFLYISIYWWRF